MPSMSSVILWLKYQGVGSMTASPALASAIMVTKKAWLQPAVMAVSDRSIAAP